MSSIVAVLVETGRTFGTHARRVGGAGTAGGHARRGTRGRGRGRDHRPVERVRGIGSIALVDDKTAETAGPGRVVVLRHAPEPVRNHGVRLVHGVLKLERALVGGIRAVLGICQVDHGGHARVAASKQGRLLRQVAAHKGRDWRNDGECQTGGERLDIGIQDLTAVGKGQGVCRVVDCQDERRVSTRLDEGPERDVLGRGRQSSVDQSKLVLSLDQRTR